MIVDLLRHGEPIGGKRFRGLQDDPLTDKGWSQMIDSTSGKKWDFIASSPLDRCSKFAKQLAFNTGTNLQIYNELVEFDWGEWQGMSAEQIGIENLNRFKNDPTKNAPRNSENLYEFNERVLSTFNKIIEQHNNKTSGLLVVHAGVIRVIKSNLMNLPLEKLFNIKVAAGSCERFEF
jgi:alpha-ribazole phosphatase/probable phosphoglycerate mutase